MVSLVMSCQKPPPLKLDPDIGGLGVRSPGVASLLMTLASFTNTAQVIISFLASGTFALLLSTFYYLVFYDPDQHSCPNPVDKHVLSFRACLFPWLMRKWKFKLGNREKYRVGCEQVTFAVLLWYLWLSPCPFTDQGVYYRRQSYPCATSRSSLVSRFSFLVLYKCAPLQHFIGNSWFTLLGFRSSRTSAPWSAADPTCVRMPLHESGEFSSSVSCFCCSLLLLFLQFSLSGT